MARYDNHIAPYGTIDGAEKIKHLSLPQRRLHPRLPRLLVLAPRHHNGESRVLLC